ncbi:MAG: mevalonate kinase, partial [Tetragenococcus halophilus]|nr:mevalonate kinase [Tetragenococcus halophilus]
HNQPAIAIPFTSAKVAVDIEETGAPLAIDSLYYQGEMAEAPDSLNNLKETIDAVTNYLKESSYGMKITIDSNIPAERGMGSSAAVATALVRALFNYFDRELTDSLLERFVTISEKIAHGNPSGIDAKVVRADEAVYFIKNQKADAFDSTIPAYLVVADTGQEGETKHAVADVGKLVADKSTKGKEWIENLGELTIQAYEKIKNKSAKDLGQILSNAQSLLGQLTVSNKKLDYLVETAMANGALGAKLTGGGRGGCMIALAADLADAEKLANALLDAKAVKTWIHPLGANNDGE